MRRDQRSPEAKAWRRLYYTNRWKAAKAAQLAREPFCRRRIHGNREVWATVVNHRKAHKGDERLFFDPNNWESLCAPCHDGPVQREERRGYDTAVDAGGWPVDPRHPSYKNSSLPK